MTPEAIKLLAIVLARDGGFFDMKANVAARTELGVSGYLRIEPSYAGIWVTARSGGALL